MSTTLNLRKIHQHKQNFLVNMIAVPFFYSETPTNILVVKGLSQQIISQSNAQMMKKLYYKNIKPIITTLLSFETTEKAIQFRQNYKKFSQEKQIKKFLCEFCKDISDFNNILFSIGSNFVIFPETKEIKEVIDTVSQMVVVDGVQVEEYLKNLNNPILSFLNERILSLENIYYRWRVYSYLQGDGDKNYRAEPFQILRNGTLWYPPLLQNANGYPSVLNLKKAIFLSQSLQKMQRKKFAIEQIMVFAINNIESAIQISSIIIIAVYERLKNDFMGIFYLISDILFNSTTHIYRNIFQSILPFLIYKYVLMKQNDEKKEMNEKHVGDLKRLLGLWERKYIFDENFMKGIIFLVQLIDIQKLYQLQKYPINEKIKAIVQNDNYLYELEKACIEYGIPYFCSKEEQAKLFLNALFWTSQKISDIEPECGKYDGQLINDKELIKIQSKNSKVVSCEGLPLSMIFQNNWKMIRSSQYSHSQDGYN